MIVIRLKRSGEIEMGFDHGIYFAILPIIALGLAVWLGFPPWVAVLSMVAVFVIQIMLVLLTPCKSRMRSSQASQKSTEK